MTIINLKSVLSKIVITKLQQEAIIIAVMLLATGGLYTASTHQVTIDPYKLEIQQRTQTVDNMMHSVSSSSSIHDLKDVQDELRLQAIWADRTRNTLNSDQLKIEKQFEVHLNSCNSILISYSKT